MKKLILAFAAVSAINMQSHAEQKEESFFIEYDTFTPLMKAIAYKEPVSEVRQLIAEGADVSAVDMEFLRHFNPVLRHALDRGTDAESVEIIRMLIEAGANVNEVTDSGGIMSLLTYAAIYSSAEVVQMFIDAGARDTIVGKGAMCFQKTALEIAQELGKEDVVKVLQAGSRADVMP